MLQFPEDKRPPVGVVLDTTMGRSIDEALTLALLHGLEGKGELRIASVSVINPDLQAAAFCEVVGRFYASSGDVSPSGFVHTLPVGLSVDRKVPAATASIPMLEVALPREPSPGDIRQLNDTAEPTALIRNALTAQYDDNAIVILNGPPTNLVKVMSLPGALELIAHKTRLLCWVTSDFNVKTDLAASQRLIAEWPGAIVNVGADIGEALRYPAASITTDYAWSPAHPIAKAYAAYRPMPYDAPAPGMALALDAIRPSEKYFARSGPGTFHCGDDGQLRWAAAPNGRHQTLRLEPAQHDRVVKAFTELASAKPVPRQPGKRASEKKEEERKKEEELKAPPKAPEKL